MRRDDFLRSHRLRYREEASRLLLAGRLPPSV